MEKDEQNVTVGEELAGFSHWLSIAKEKNESIAKNKNESWIILRILIQGTGKMIVTLT